MPWSFCALSFSFILYPDGALEERLVDDTMSLALQTCGQEGPGSCHIIHVDPSEDFLEPFPTLAGGYFVFPDAQFLGGSRFAGPDT